VRLLLIRLEIVNLRPFLAAILTRKVDQIDKFLVSDEGLLADLCIA